MDFTFMGFFCLTSISLKLGTQIWQKKAKVKAVVSDL